MVRMKMAENNVRDIKNSCARFQEPPHGAGPAIEQQFLASAFHEYGTGTASE